MVRSSRLITAGQNAELYNAMPHDCFHDDFRLLHDLLASRAHRPRHYHRSSPLHLLKIAPLAAKRSAIYLVNFDFDGPAFRFAMSPLTAGRCSEHAQMMVTCYAGDTFV